MQISHLTELTERLASEGSQALRQELANKLAAMEARLRNTLATQLLTREEFERATLLATAGELAQRVVGRTASAKEAPDARKLLGPLN